jgi:ankyrin repeat protein
LHYAAAKGNSQAVDVLLKESDVAIDARIEDIGTTPLQFAAHGGHLESVRLLIDAYKTKEKISEIDTRDNQNTSTLQYAALGIQEDMNREVAELLVKAGADPLQMDGDISLMDMAAVAGNSAMIEYCMEKVFNHKNEKPIILSAIKIAKRKGHTHIAVMLQSRYEALQSNS